MRYISLCSGVETATLAWEQLGWEPIAFAEIEEFPSAILSVRFPDIPNLGDFTKVDWSKYRGAVDLVAGGFPCQSYSLAGNRGGLADPRGNLALEFLRVAREIDPEWIVGENVPGLLSSAKGRDFQTILETVADFWPRGASLGGFWTLSSCEYPVGEITERLSDGSVRYHSAAAVSFLSSILETGDVPERYRLSVRACSGILNRAGRRGKPLPPMLKEALEEVVRVG